MSAEVTSPGTTSAGPIHVGTPGPLPARRRRRGIRIAVILGIGAVLVAGAAWASANSQRIDDQFVVWNFTPSAAIKTYATRSTMTDEGRFLFYASTPVIAQENRFDKICADHQEDVGILGCYVPGDREIFLYDVTDARLDGIEEVVAAHEMLHAAWDRMSEGERKALEPLLEAEAAKRADDKEFAATLAFYAKAEPGERVNELHSIIGTEFDTVSTELERHYAIYFTDRAALIAMHQKSNQVFVEQAAQIDALVTQLDALAAAINADYATYNAGYDRLNADIGSFNTRADNGSFTSEAQFNAERSSLMRRQANLDALYASIDTRSTQYDALLAQLDTLNAAADDLARSINIEPRQTDGL